MLIAHCVDDYMSHLAYKRSFVAINCIYSYRNASTGLRLAARQLCQLIVIKAITNADSPAKANIHQLKVVL